MTQEFRPGNQRGTWLYRGKDAAIVLDQDGLVVTGWATTRAGRRFPVPEEVPTRAGGARASNVIDNVPEPHRQLFVNLLQERDRALLEQLRTQEKPTQAQAGTVTEVFALEFMANIGPDHNYPTEWAVRIDDALGAFLKRWPGEILDS